METATMEAPEPKSIDVSNVDTPADRGPGMHEHAIARLKLIEELNSEIEAQQRKKKRRETEVAKLTAERKVGMGEVNALTKAVEELHEELGKLISGKASERLPFVPRGDAKPAPVPAAPAPEKPQNDAWRSVRLDSLEVSDGKPLTPGKLKALAEHEPRIETLGDLVDYQGAKGDWWAKEVKGLGKGGAEQLAVACERYWSEHPQERLIAKPLPDPRFLGAEALGLNPGGVAALAHMHLLTRMHVGQVPELRAVVGYCDEVYAVTQAPVEMGRDVYALRKLLPAEMLPAGQGAFPDGWLQRPDDPFFGGAVRCQGKDFRIASQSEAIFVRDPQEAAS